MDLLLLRLDVNLEEIQDRKERSIYDGEEVLASGFTRTVMWIRVLSANLTGGCCGAVSPPILDLAMAGKGSLGAIFRGVDCNCFCDRRRDAEEDV